RALAHDPGSSAAKLPIGAVEQRLLVVVRGGGFLLLACSRLLGPAFGTGFSADTELLTQIGRFLADGLCLVAQLLQALFQITQPAAFVAARCRRLLPCFSHYSPFSINPRYIAEFKSILVTLVVGIAGAVLVLFS